MAFHIKNPDADVLARELARLNRTGLTESVPTALENELERQSGEPSLVELGVAFCQSLREKGNPKRGKSADPPFIDSLYADG